jgi:hypothetical protein
MFFEDSTNSDRYCQQFLDPFIGHLNEDGIGREYFQGTPLAPVWRFCAMYSVNT